MSSVALLVFAQSDDTALPFERLSTHARAHFDAVLATDGPRDSGAARISYETDAARGDFDVCIRLAGAEDRDAAREIERRKPTGGLADLAARCKAVWEVDARGEPPEWLVFEFAALLASVALGPILTPDHSILLGVRSARERANRLRGGAALTR
jgi:hypothetical protein